MARRRASPFNSPFDDFFSDFDEIEGMMDELFRNIQHGKLQPGQPLVYGVNIRVGPDGKPVINQFGNVTPKGVKPERDPLVDVIHENANVRVLAELPGVDKNAIRVNALDDALSISVEDDARPFAKRVALPAKIKPEGVKATYKNGILEVLLPKQAPGKPKAPTGKTVRVG